MNLDQQFLTSIESVSSFGGAPIVVGASPISLTATADADSIVLGWTDGDTYTSTVIERKTTGDWETLDTAAGDATSYDDITAVVGIEYTYRVRGVKDTYPTPYSNEASDTIEETTIDAPSLLVDGGSVLDDQATLSWTNNGPLLDDSYPKTYVEQNFNAAGYTVVAEIVEEQGATGGWNSDILANGSYTFRVRGWSDGVYSEYSNEIVVVISV